MKKRLYCIWIWGIGVSALARYYLSEWWEVFGSDKNNSHNIEKLKSEWCDIIIWWDSSRIIPDIELIIHTEAIPESQAELKKARKLWIKTLKYNQALAGVVNSTQLIAIAGTHGKSTTTSLVAQILQKSDIDFFAVIGTLLKEFDGKNFYSQWNAEYAVIEACEYKEHFLAYKPFIAVITNIEYDHADYFKTPESYIAVYEKFIQNIHPWGYCILNHDDKNCYNLVWKRSDINYILVSQEWFSIYWSEEEIIYTFPEIDMKVPGEHVLFDAKLAYIVSHILGIQDENITQTLSQYSGVWRRMEIIWNTTNGNQLMSDYGHHPTEVQVTLKALKQWYPDKKIFTIFQPHQYSRTLELLDWFIEAFHDTDILVIPNIYESRDSETDKQKINTQKFVDAVNHSQVFNGESLENTLELIQEYDSEYPDSSIILLLWAWDVDSLRDEIKVL